VGNLSVGTCLLIVFYYLCVVLEGILQNNTGNIDKIYFGDQVALTSGQTLMEYRRNKYTGSMPLTPK
jgi:hypothetical protein